MRILRLYFLSISLLIAATVSSAATETYYFFVFSNPIASHEEEYNKWYDQLHAPDVVSIPGFVTAQRFIKNDLPLYRMVDLQVPKYLVVYKIATDDIEGVFKEVSRRLETGETFMSPAFDRATSVSYVYKPFRPEIKGVGGEPKDARPGPKQSYYQIVFTAMVQGKEQEFNRFYDDHHAPELAAIPGFTSAQRMILARPTAATIPATKYLALFKVETSDLTAVKKIAAGPGFTASPAFDREATRGYTFRAIGPVVEGDRVRATRRELDPLRADPRHYTVDVENQWVRVIRERMGPRATMAMHQHPNPGAVIVFLTDRHNRLTTADGRTQELRNPADDLMWSPASGHRSENLTDSPFEAVQIEPRWPSGTRPPPFLPDALDAPKIDPQHYHVELENEFVRVLRVNIGPHEKLALHTHPQTGAILVQLTDQNLRLTQADGTARASTYPAKIARWVEPGAAHQDENLSDQPLRFIRVELKLAVGASDPRGRATH